MDDPALKSSTNYVETHRTIKGPDGTREYHEVRSYSSGGDLRMDPAEISLVPILRITFFGRKAFGKSFILG
jgi:hypothetical protein